MFSVGVIFNLTKTTTNNKHPSVFEYTHSGFKSEYSIVPSRGRIRHKHRGNLVKRKKKYCFLFIYLLNRGDCAGEECEGFSAGSLQASEGVQV